MDAAGFFKENKWIYLSRAVAVERCQQLTKYMFDLYEKGALVKDEQCPLSDAIYGAPLLDDLLKELAPILSGQIGVELDPAYTYARIYRPGEVLEHHRDRPSCEISGTMTLGFDPSQQVWPLYFAHEEQDRKGTEVLINVGDLLLYRGEELYHWRPAFKGTWQVQVFFHFVDRNGPNKALKYDGRSQIGSTQSHTPPEVIYDSVVLPLASVDEVPGACKYDSTFKPNLTLTREECNRAIALTSGLYGHKAAVGTKTGGDYAPEVREVEEFDIPLRSDTKWLYEKLGTAVSVANKEYYKFDIVGIVHSLKLLRYVPGEVNGHYTWHADVGSGNSAARKISIVAMLSNPNEYEGGILEIDNHGVKLEASKEQGSLHMFPSYMSHRVTPVTKGERWTLVVWVHGSQRFK